MKPRALWLDAHLSPRLAHWIAARFALNCLQIRQLGLQSAADLEIFLAARNEHAASLTKDGDFKGLVQRLGPPPAILLLTCGNTSDHFLRDVLENQLGSALQAIQTGAPLIALG